MPASELWHTTREATRLVKRLKQHISSGPLTERSERRVEHILRQLSRVAARGLCAFKGGPISSATGSKPTLRLRKRKSAPGVGVFAKTSSRKVAKTGHAEEKAAAPAQKLTGPISTASSSSDVHEVPAPPPATDTPLAVLTRRHRPKPRAQSGSQSRFANSRTPQVARTYRKPVIVPFSNPPRKPRRRRPMPTSTAQQENVLGLSNSYNGRPHPVAIAVKEASASVRAASSAPSNAPSRSQSKPSEWTQEIATKRLKKTNIQRTPGGTPLERSYESTDSQFIRQLLTKFRHARTPPRPRHSSAAADITDDEDDSDWV